MKITATILAAYLAVCAFLYWYNKPNWPDAGQKITRQEKLARFLLPWRILKQKKD